MPSLSLEKNKVELKRYEQLARALGFDLQAITSQTSGDQIFVHWIYLNQDELIDAVVILKPDASSCGLRAQCTGKILKATEEGFRAVSVFLPNHHPVYFGASSENQGFQNFYITEDGVNFSELTFEEGRYRLQRKHLSQALVEDSASRIVHEGDFDNLAEQVAEVQKSGSLPLRAPIILKIVKPPIAKITSLMRIGHQSAQDMKRNISQFFSRVAQNHTLSHTVTVELVACDDWVARVPLQNQKDRSSSHVAVCQEVFGMVDNRIVPTLRKNENYLLKRKADGIKRKIAKGKSAWTQEKLKNAIQKEREKIEQSLKQLNPDEKIKSLLFIIIGSLGQVLGLQNNLQAELIKYIDNDETTDSAILKKVRQKLIQEPTYLSYLFGSLLQTKAIFSSGLEARYIVSRIIFMKNHVRIQKARFEAPDRKEYAVLQKDMGMRVWSGACAERGVKEIPEKK